MNQNMPDMTEEEREAQRLRRREKRRREERRKRLRRRRMIRMGLLAGCMLLLVLLLILGIRGLAHLHRNQEKASVKQEQETGPVTDIPETEAGEKSVQEPEMPVETEPEEEETPLADFSSEITIDPLPVSWQTGYTAGVSDSVRYPDETQMTSAQAVLINESTNTIEVQKDAGTRIYPASMTKILTILVAAEHVQDLDEEVTITQEMTDYAYSNDCSIVGYAVGEQAPVRDLFYGTILPSGADAAVALAEYVAGSHEEFVGMMNEKIEDLGLEGTHFTNCVGLYDDNHYSTAYDMAMIMKAAVENDWCRQVLNARTYTTTATEQHPDGILISNWFMRRIEDKDCGGVVQGAKTGFVNQSGSCAASYALSPSGTPYICVTVNAHSSWRCIYDHVAMYKLYATN